MRERIQSILGNLESVEEDLRALSDDIWLDIDHNDSEAVKSGAAYKISFNAAMGALSKAADDVSRVITEFTDVPRFDPPTAPATPAERDQRERSIEALDQRTPHSLDEDFRYRRPSAFRVGDVPFNGTHTWAQVHETLCRYLRGQDTGTFAKLPDRQDFTSSKGNRYLSRDADDLRSPKDVGSGVFLETNLSANQIRDNIRRLLEAFAIPPSEFVAYLREDRDAAP